MIRTYQEAVKFLDRYIPDLSGKFPGRLGLERMKYLCELLGNPQLKYPTIHIGGTSGKGSTATIIASILATKYKVGLHTSPHLEKINERITLLQCNNVTMKQCNNENISDKDFIELVNYIIPSIEKLEKSKFGKPSYFEITTALAFLYFVNKKVDFAVIEVGMGGRFDGTNIIKPLVAVLTNVGLDHTEILGNTIEKIAQDKAGIIKSHIQVVSGAKQKSVIEIIKSNIKNQKSKISLLHKDFTYKIKEMKQKGSVFDYIGEQTMKDLRLPLLGEHQVENAALALRVVESTNQLINKSTYQQIINRDDIRKALSRVFIPGRLEIVHHNPLVILDGAHNPDKVEALSDAIKTIFPHKRLISIVAIKNDKNAKEMIGKILSFSDEVIFTEYELITDLGKTYSYKTTQLMEIVKQCNNVTMQQNNNEKIIIDKNVIHALNFAIEKADRDDLILVTGSLYLVGEIRRKLKIQNPKKAQNLKSKLFERI